MASYPLDGTDLAAGSEVWADTLPIIDQSALNTQSSEAAQKERTVKASMGGAWAGTYDAAGSQALSTTPTDLTGGANWDGSFGPAAYNCTITATTLDGITPAIAGLYDIQLSLNWITAAAHTVTFAIYQGAAIVATGFQARSMSVTETASQYQSVALRGTAELAAGAEVRVFVSCASGTPTLTYRDLLLQIRRIGPAA